MTTAISKKTQQEDRWENLKRLQKMRNLDESICKPWRDIKKLASFSQVIIKVKPLAQVDLVIKKSTCQVNYEKLSRVFS